MYEFTLHVYSFCDVSKPVTSQSPKRHRGHVVFIKPFSSFGSLILDHGALCLQLDEERVHYDSSVIDIAGHHGQSSGVLPLVSQRTSQKHWRCSINTPRRRHNRQYSVCKTVARGKNRPWDLQRINQIMNQDTI